MPRSLSSKLIISAAAALFIISAAALGALATVFQWYPQITLEYELLSNAGHVADGLRFDRSGRLVQVAVSPLMREVYDVLQTDVMYRVLDERGVVLIASDGVMTPLTPQGERFALPATGKRNFVLTGPRVTLHVLTKLVTRGKQHFYIQVGRSERFHQALLGDEKSIFSRAAMIAVLVALLVFIGVVWCTFRHALKPLRNASEAASRIESNNLHARLSIKDMPRELLPLIDAFNKALDRLESGYRAQQDFLGTVAHELKTPLALIRGEIELGGLADRQLLLKDVDRMARQVHQLLHLAEVSDRKNFLFAQVDAGAVVSDAVEHLKRLSNRVDVAVDLVLPERLLLLHADGAALFVLVKNLLENALHHAPAGGKISIILGQNRLSVRDYGSGIAAEDIPFIFQRFWRGAERRDTGAGLGLAICSEIALAHGWLLTVHSPAPSGAEFIVAF